MDWLQALDVDVFRFINGSLSNPFLDTIMPVFSGNPVFIPALVLLCLLLLWKGGRRGVICVLMVVLIVSLGDGVICRMIKQAVGRDRPFLSLSDVHCLLGKSHSGSMPSSHAANWFAGTMVAFIYYRRSVWIMLPMAVLVGLSRIYTGMHYPSDVLAGSILGAGYAAAAVWLLDRAWQWAGRKWFPLWWAKLPSLMAPSLDLTANSDTGEVGPSQNQAQLEREAAHASIDAHWLRLGYLVTAILLFARLAYIASGTIQLAEDEAYQWLWSKHLALSYYSKPPLISYIQFLGTSIWGDTAFGIRFFSPVITTILSVLLLRFFAREINARAGFLLMLIVNATPLVALGGILMTVDPPSVLFWTAAMLAGWRAVQQDGSVKDWLWTGLWMGLGFLSKYTELVQILCWALFFWLWPAARKHLRRPGPYLALLVNFLCAVPVLIWNQQHQWITVEHLGDVANAHKPWKPTLKYFFGFLGSEFALLNPVFFVGMIWAAIAFWRRGRKNPRLVFLFCMGAPVFLLYLAQSFRGKILPNWIAPSVLPLFCLMAIYWDARWRLGLDQVKTWLTGGLVLGSTMVILAHNTDFIGKLTGHYLPVKKDPLHRVRGWSDVARVIADTRKELLSEGKPVFIIAAHYGLVGQISFYLPEAKAIVGDNPLVFSPTSPTPKNQLFFWPGYTGRKGENAVYVQELDRDRPNPQPPPPALEAEFESISDMGVRNVLYHGKLLRPLQCFACRGLR
jgi:membrane-associated phospholipid phosphatase